jgi:uncharacterized protein YbjQ (UPF0145 family)
MFGRSKSQQSDAQVSVKITPIEALDKEIEGYDLEGGPSTTTMSANELYLIEQAGYEVLQIVYGNVVYSMGIRGIFRSLTRALTRGEMPDFTRMNNDARVIARNRMAQKARELGADKVVSVTIEVQEFADFLEVTTTGTAVKRRADWSRNEVPVAVSA